MWDHAVNNNEGEARMISSARWRVTRLSWWRCRQPGWCPGCPAAPSPSYRPGSSWPPAWTSRRPRCRCRAPAGRRTSSRSPRGCWEPWWSWSTERLPLLRAARMTQASTPSLLRAAWTRPRCCCCYRVAARAQCACAAACARPCVLTSTILSPWRFK